MFTDICDNNSNEIPENLIIAEGFICMLHYHTLMNVVLYQNVKLIEKQKLNQKLNWLMLKELEKKELSECGLIHYD